MSKTVWMKEAGNILLPFKRHSHGTDHRGGTRLLDGVHGFGRGQRSGLKKQQLDRILLLASTISTLGHHPS